GKGKTKEFETKIGTVFLGENVVGVLSTRDNAFGSCIGALVGEDEPLIPSGKRWPNAGVVVGPKRTIAWRVLDAKYFGVAQRRRRVFLIGAPTGQGFDPSKVLFEFDGKRRDIAPSYEERQEDTATIAQSPRGRGSFGEEVGTLCARDHKGIGNQYVGEGKVIVEVDPVYGLPGNWIGRKLENGGNSTTPMLETSPCLTATDRHGIVSYHHKARRMTPIEFERLQGFKDNYTQISWRGKEPNDCPDGHRYKAVGNSMAIPVMKFLGERI